MKVSTFPLLLLIILGLAQTPVAPNKVDLGTESISGRSSRSRMVNR
jgi:hypothetical protein